MKSIRDRAVDLIPGFRDYDEQKSNANKLAQAFGNYVRDLPKAQDALNMALNAATIAGSADFEELERLAREVVDAGQHALEIPPGPGGTAQALVNNGRIAQARALIGSEFIVRSQQEPLWWDAAVDPALEFLSEELEAIGEEVLEADGILQDITTAGQAIRASGEAIKAWNSIEMMVSRYDDLRAAQVEIVSTIAAPGDLSALAAVFNSGFLADAINHEKFWTSRRTFSASVTPKSTTEQADWAAWLGSAEVNPISEKDDNSWWTSVDKATYLRWIFNQADPWVPTFQLMMEAHAAATSATNEAMGKSEVAAHVAARERYLKLTAPKVRMH